MEKKNVAVLLRWHTPASSPSSFIQSLSGVSLDLSARVHMFYARSQYALVWINLFIFRVIDLPEPFFFSCSVFWGIGALLWMSAGRGHGASAVDSDRL